MKRTKIKKWNIIEEEVDLPALEPVASKITNITNEPPRGKTNNVVSEQV